MYATGGDGLLIAWQVRGASRLLTLGEDAPARRAASLLPVAPAPDRLTVARVRTAKLWFEDARTGRPVTRAVSNQDTYFVWSPNARWLLSGGDNDLIKLWTGAQGP